MSNLPVSQPPKPVKRFTRLRDLTRWRRVAVGIWGPPDDPHVYGELKVDATNALALVQRLRASHNVKVTLSHVFVKAVGAMLAQYPHFNVMLRRRRFYQRATADIFMQVAIEEGAGDLGGIKIESVDKKNILELTSEIGARAAKVRRYEDADLEKTKKSLQSTPPLLMRTLVKTVDVLSNDLGLNLSFLGLKPDAFGGAMVTNIGSFGLPHGYAPLVPGSRVPMLFCMGAVGDEPVVHQGQVVIRPMLTCTGTFDHRIFDGLQLAKLCRAVRERFVEPDWIEAELSGTP